MSSGPGVLQKRILDYLKTQPFVFYNQLLWNFAFERKEIEEVSNLSPHIEKGRIKRSFKENFRRSIESLAKNQTIIIEKRVVPDIDEAFEYFPYHTDRLEIHQLRRALLPALKEYIIDENPRKFGDSKIEEELISRSKIDPGYTDIKETWKRIEKEIIAILDTESPLYDSWLQILVRGRYLFSSNSIPHVTSFIRLYAILFKSNNGLPNKEGDILRNINTLISMAFENVEWRMGKTKAVYYDMANMRQYAKDSLKENVKEYLLNKRNDIITNLPGHKEPKREKTGGISWYNPRETVYSGYLDHLLTRQILRKQKILTYNAMPS